MDVEGVPGSHGSTNCRTCGGCGPDKGLWGRDSAPRRGLWSGLLAGRFLSHHRFCSLVRPGVESMTTKVCEVYVYMVGYILVVF